MSDETATPENGEWGEWGAGEPEAGGYVAPATGDGGIHVVPSLPPHRENHALTLSFQPGGKDSPMLVLRAETAAEMNSLITQVEMAGLWANVGSHMSTVRAQGVLGAGMPGQVQAAPQQPMQVTPQGIPMHPQAQFGAPLGAGGAPGTAPAQWQNAGAPAPAPAMAQPGWFRVNIPYASKNIGDQIKQNLKNAGLYQGNVRWDAASKTWLVSPNVVAHFQQFNPTPA